MSEKSMSEKKESLNSTSQKPPKHPSSDVSSSSSSNGNKRKGSIWWSHFDRMVDDINYAKCKYCDTKIGCAAKNGTTPLANHIKRCKQLPANMDKKQKLMRVETKTIVRDDGVFETISLPSCWQFDQTTCRKALARMIIVDELPFAFVEHEGFIYFCKCLNPAFSIPSRKTIARDCYRFFIEEKRKLKTIFETLSSRISLTTDAWTSGQNLSYMCLTAHFIDENWVLHKRIINFCPLAGHSGHLIGRGVEKCLIDWGLKKIMTVTVDNASSNDLAVDYLRRRLNHWESSILDGKFLHIRCVAHIFNLVVKDGLKDMDSSIVKVRTIVKYVRSSPARLQKFKSCVEEEKIESKSLVCLDVETRWNSTYLMLESAVKFKKAFDNLIIRDSSCYKEMMKVSGGPNDEDWRRVSHFLPILKIFYDATLMLSGSRYVTCNSCAQSVFAIGLEISNLCKSDDEGCRKMAEQMKLKYDKYWGDILNINYLIFISMLLDPRHKMHLVDWVVRNCFDDTKSTLLNLNVKILIDELFKLYTSSMPQEDKQKSSASNSALNNRNENRQGEVMDFAKLLTSRFQMEVGFDHPQRNKSELDKYLEEPLENDCENFNILSWWKDNQRRFPILAKMARDVLAIPVTTVASESAFSTGGRVLDSFRTSLTPRIVEALICTQDWERTTKAVVIEESLASLEQLEEGLIF